MKFTPRHDFVLIKMDAPEEISRGGILLPQSAQEERSQGTIVAIGPGRKSDFGAFLPVEGLAVGDKVLFNKFTAQELDDNERLYLIRNGDIHCVMK